MINAFLLAAFGLFTVGILMIALTPAVYQRAVECIEDPASQVVGFDETCQNMYLIWRFFPLIAIFASAFFVVKAVQRRGQYAQ